MKKSRFPWAASGRSLSLSDGTKGLQNFYLKRKQIESLGGIIGPYAGDLISEVALAIEMGADAADIGMTVHPHPTLSETIAFSAEAQEGILTDLYMPKNIKNVYFYLIFIPGFAPSSVDNKNIWSPPGPAANIMPSDVPNFIFLGARFAATTTLLPTKSSTL